MVSLFNPSFFIFEIFWIIMFRFFFDMFRSFVVLLIFFLEFFIILLRFFMMLFDLFWFSYWRKWSRMRVIAVLSNFTFFWIFVFFLISMPFFIFYFNFLVCIFSWRCFTFFCIFSWRSFTFFYILYLVRTGRIFFIFCWTLAATIVFRFLHFLSLLYRFH